MIEKTYKSSETVEAADVMEYEMSYLYHDDVTWYFMNSSTFEQLEVRKDVVGDQWKWLKEQIEAKKIAFNEDGSMVHLVQEGLLLEHERIFRDFTKAFSEYRDWIVVYKQFNHLGLTRLSGQDYKFEQYFSDSPYKTVGKQTSMFSKDTKTTILPKNRNTSNKLFSNRQLNNKEP